MRILFFLATFLVCAGLAIAGGLYWFLDYVRIAGPLNSEKIVFIAPGTGVRAMAEQLGREGVIEQPYAFMAVVKMRDVAGKLKAGEYQMPAHISLQDAVEQMVRGDVYARKVTIPEGLNRYEIIEILRKAEALSGDIEPMPAEGSILPDTYAYIRNDSRAKLLGQMERAMTATLDALWNKRAPNLPFASKEQALALASVVEKETGIASERPRIAGVFMNRLRIGMKLQSDPTVIFAVTEGKAKLERVLYEHLEKDSPYNTYKYAGIPPGPICSPGRAAIEAVLNPEVNDFLYFVADGQGGHVFAKTIEEHNANVQNWRAVQRNR